MPAWQPSVEDGSGVFEGDVNVNNGIFSQRHFGGG
jgi:hypothetical protein